MQHMCQTACLHPALSCKCMSTTLLHTSFVAHVNLIAHLSAENKSCTHCVCSTNAPTSGSAAVSHQPTAGELMSRQSPNGSHSMWTEVAHSTLPADMRLEWCWTTWKHPGNLAHTGPKLTRPIISQPALPTTSVPQLFACCCMVEQVVKPSGGICDCISLLGRTSLLALPVLLQTTTANTKQHMV